MSALKMNVLIPLVIKMPESLDDSTLKKIYDENENIYNSKEVHLDFSLTNHVDKTFYTSLHMFKKDMADKNILYKSLNISSSLKNQFVSHGTYSYLNFSSGQKKSLLDVNFIQPFIDSTIKVLEVQTNIKTTMHSPYLKPVPSDTNNIEIAGVISIVSDAFIGTIALCFPKQTFLKICFQLFGEAQQEITSEIEDAAAEILNMIFGGAKAELNKNKNYGIQKALPTIIRADSLQLSQYTGTTMILPFVSDAGEFHIEIELVSKD